MFFLRIVVLIIADAILSFAGGFAIWGLSDYIGISYDPTYWQAFFLAFLVIVLVSLGMTSHEISRDNE